MDDDERQEFMESLGFDEPGLNRVIRAGYALLNLHTDFEKGFIRAQTISYDDYINYKGEVGAKEAGKMSAEGKDYIVKDGDVITFLFNVKK